ncbi:FAD binding domain-containing protein [Microbacterium amylolyticum]|uniref:CO/xanthine dehydrogenase FAD-binding subunit n=1 Tax=Microbacterium amylolyticum TaxID=936337 RepID=A0ABS4ZHG7_9MICO|nr:FAD binding domain-containing protein [Microbacterium amylolyticum]MBP2436448.1 CO/xanthine dehydrogenase FAD-binding subunit [Microbacterium amylolyticum]
MDLDTVTSYRRASTRADLALAPGETLLAGGTLLFSEQNPEVTGLVDLTSLGWPDIEETSTGLRIAATCTIARLVEYSRASIFPAATLFEDAAHALLASAKIWNMATVGGNIVQSYAAAAMVSMAVALDAEAEIWSPDGSNRRVPVAAIPADNGANTLAPGEILRAIDIPSGTLRSRTVLQKEALADFGRSGAVVTGRLDDNGAATFAVTAATTTPRIVRFVALPDAEQLATAVGAVGGWYTDPLGSADWRQAISVVLAERARKDLA